MGPLPANTEHFWRMVLENDVSTIIMATGLIEKGVNKCEEYWPQVVKSKLKFGKITVRSESVASGNGSQRTKLVVKQGKLVHNVEHFWFTSWPDHGVPRTADGTPDPTDIITMLNEVHQLRDAQDACGPLLVHCSAGIGRSGTIIAIDWAVRQLRAKGRCIPLKIVETIRQE